VNPETLSEGNSLHIGPSAGEDRKTHRNTPERWGKGRARRDTAWLRWDGGGRKREGERRRQERRDHRGCGRRGWGRGEHDEVSVFVDVRLGV
jgi:hypothetical protein